MIKTLSLFFVASLLTWSMCSAQQGFFLKRNHSQGWDRALGILFDNQGNQFVWEKKGIFYQFHNNQKIPIIDISEEVGDWSDAGLLSARLHPQFDENGYVYLFYVVDRHHLLHYGTADYSSTANEYEQATIGRVTRYTLSKNPDNTYSVDMTSRKVLLGSVASNGIPILYKSHMIGGLAFGTDGTLLLSAGDVAHFGREDYGSDPETFYQQALDDGIIRQKENVGSFRAQLIDCYNGKILRIDPETGDGISSNPFYDPLNKSSARSKVWAMGLRNPYRFTVKPNSGSSNPEDGNPGIVFIGDVGMGDFEELNIADKPGLNFGWPVYEGSSFHHKYPGYPEGPIYNMDVPVETNGCGTVYASFTDLLLEDKRTRTYPSLSFCNETITLDTTLFHFVTRPVLDMSHWGPAHIPKYNSNGDPIYIDIKHPNAEVTVDADVVLNHCIVTGDFYTGNNFPEKYRNTLFYADYVNMNIYSVAFDSRFKIKSLTQINSLLSPAMENFIVGLYYNEHEDAFYCIEYTNSISRFSFENVLPPVANLSSDKQYGDAPLELTLDASKSADPDKSEALTYFFDFGDGTTFEGDSIVTHTYATTSEPAAYKVLLKVTDIDGFSDTTSVKIWVDNTPPEISIERSHFKYSLESTTQVRLTATGTDNEHTALQYTWGTFLYHDEHNHPDPLVMDPTITFMIDPLGCGSETYHYRAKITVADPLGLSTTEELFFYPDCLRPRMLRADGGPYLVDLSWTKPLSNPDSYPDSYLVIANKKDTISFDPVTFEVPSGVSSNFDVAPLLADEGRVVYAGSDSTVHVTHLDNFSDYHFFVFGKKGTEWSEPNRIKVTTLLVTGEEAAFLEGLSIYIYPVPAKNEININWNNSGQPATTRCRVLNMHGQTLDDFSIHITNGTGTFSRSLEGVPPGILILQLTTGLDMRMFKIFKN